MSRIEKALEMAAQLRNAGQGAVAEGAGAAVVEREGVNLPREAAAAGETGGAAARERAVPAAAAGPAPHPAEPPATHAAGSSAPAPRSTPASPGAPAPRSAPLSQGAPRTVSLKVDTRLMPTLMEPHSAVAEQYRKLKSRIVQATRGEHFSNVLMVTSAAAGEGKSLTATNLAICMAHEFDLTVLLVDADLRRPSIHRYLGFEQTLGLSDCLQDGVDLGEAIVRTDLERLSVLPAGREVAKPLELFGSRKMHNLIKEVKNRYNDRYVIIDTPPILPFAETRPLAHLVDGVIFVVQEGMTPKDGVTQAIEVLKGCPILGLVLNASTNMNPEYSYYGEYYGRVKGS